MEREILFRCWDVQAKKMFIPKEISNGLICSIPEDDDEQFFVHMQYSGHRIKGIRLFEGDIVRNEISTDEGDRRLYYICMFIKEWAMFSLLESEEYADYKKSGADALDESMFWTFPIEEKENELRAICGNIYEHPKLLTSNNI